MQERQINTQHKKQKKYKKNNAFSVLPTFNYSSLDFDSEFNIDLKTVEWLMLQTEKKHLTINTLRQGGPKVHTLCKWQHINPSIFHVVVTSWQFCTKNTLMTWSFRVSRYSLLSKSGMNTLAVMPFVYKRHCQMQAHKEKTAINLLCDEKRWRAKNRLLAKELQHK